MSHSEPKTLYDKLWDRHLLEDLGDDIGLIYIDRHLVHEVSSPQAFQGLRDAGRKIWRKESILVIPDHNVPTLNRQQAIEDSMAKKQLDVLEQNVRDFSLNYISLHDRRQGIVHVVGPEQGFTLPGLSVVCGDSHTSTHGAFACLAFGIGTSQLEHVLASQTLQVEKAKRFLVRIEGKLSPGLSAKDLALALIGKIGTGGATGYALEFQGPVVQELSMEGRMTLCNMAIEAGARTGLVGVDDTTLDYVRGRPLSPQDEQWERAEAYWRTLVSDAQAQFDRYLVIDASSLSPQLTWGTSPQMVIGVDQTIPYIDSLPEDQQQDAARAMSYMGVQEGQSLHDLVIDKVFIGSCTNSRIEDLRQVALIVQGRRLAPTVKQALVVPGSGAVKEQAEQEGLAHVFLQAGFEWREPGCSMCIGMNGDILLPAERCASTSNRNFEGRQGALGRTHLVSPAMAAAAAIAGHFVDVRDYYERR